MRLLCEYPAGVLRNAVTTNHVPSVASVVRNLPGVGKPFLIFASLPGNPVMVDFSMYPQYIVSSDISANIDMINAMLDNPPIDAVTFPEEA